MNKIPTEAKRVFKGEIFDVYQWQQKLYDGSFATFERITRQNTAIVLGVTIDKKILIIEDEQPAKPKTTQLVAGKIEDNESPEDGARREFLEETGYQIGELIPWFHFNPDNKIVWTVHVFVAKNCQKVAAPATEPGEKITVKLLDFADFIEQVLNDHIQGSLLKIKILEAKLDPQKMSDLHSLLFT